jgi:hypothetical protein
MISLQPSCRLAVMMLVTSFGVCLYADTVTLRSNASYNGTITSLSASNLQISGRFKRTTTGLDVPLASIASVEFNDLIDNSGAAPAFGAHEAKNELKTTSKPPAVVAGPTDVLVLVGGQRVKCSVLSMDRNGLHCDGSDYERESLFRIEFRRR